MATVVLRNNRCETSGELPSKGTKAPSFVFVKTDLSECSVDDFEGKNVVLNIFPSIDTPTCAASVRAFNQKATEVENTVVLCVSGDLPFAHKRFCETEGIENVVPVSTFRNPDFGMSYGITLINGAFKGLLSRAVVVIDATGTVIYTELVPVISQEPDYRSALKALMAE